MKDAEVRKIFKKKVGNHMRYMIHRVKRTKKKLDFITVDNWTIITRTLETEKYKQMCEMDKKNWDSSSSDGFASATYVESFINIDEHKRRMISLFKLVRSFNSMITHLFLNFIGRWIGDRTHIYSYIWTHISEKG